MQAIGNLTEGPGECNPDVDAEVYNHPGEILVVERWPQGTDDSPNELSEAVSKPNCSSAFLNSACLWLFLRSTFAWYRNFCWRMTSVVFATMRAPRRAMPPSHPPPPPFLLLLEKAVKAVEA